MNGNSLLLDSNIVLYLLNGEKTLIPLLEGKQLYLSFITQIELLSYHEISSAEVETIDSFIQECIVNDMTSSLKELTIKLRKKYRIKLPDAIIAATSLYLNSPLVTADAGFKKLDDDIDIIFYER